MAKKASKEIIPVKSGELPYMEKLFNIVREEKKLSLIKKEFKSMIDFIFPLDMDTKKTVAIFPGDFTSDNPMMRLYRKQFEKFVLPKKPTEEITKFLVEKKKPELVHVIPEKTVLVMRVPKTLDEQLQLEVDSVFQKKEGRMAFIDMGPNNPLFKEALVREYWRLGKDISRIKFAVQNIKKQLNFMNLFELPERNYQHEEIGCILSTSNYKESVSIKQSELEECFGKSVSEKFGTLKERNFFRIMTEEERQTMIEKMLERKTSAPAPDETEIEEDEEEFEVPSEVLDLITGEPKENSTTTELSKETETEESMNFGR